MEFYYAELDKDVLIVRADGDLNSDSAEQFVAQLGGFVDGGLTRIIVDCSRLEHITSYGLGVLVRLHARLAKRGGDVKLASVPGLIEQVRDGAGDPPIPEDANHVDPCLHRLGVPKAIQDHAVHLRPTLHPAEQVHGRLLLLG